MDKFKIGDLVKGIEYSSDIINKDLLKAEVLGYMGTFSSLTKIKIIEHNNEKYIGQTIYYVDEKLLGGYYNNKRDDLQYLSYEVEYIPINVRYKEKKIPHRISGFLTFDDAKIIAEQYRKDIRVIDVKIIELITTEKEIEF